LAFEADISLSVKTHKKRWKKRDLSSLDVLSRYFPGRNEENHKKSAVTITSLSCQSLLIYLTKILRQSC
jgi:hypothetical protein